MAKSKKLASSANKPRLIVIVGPTASGKTALSLKLAQKFSGEIVSADSRAIYKKLNIGSAKPNIAERKIIPHHLINVVEPDEILTLSQYKKLAIEKIKKITDRHQLPFLVGGTALYIYAVIDNWQIPEVPPNPILRAKLEKQSVEKLYFQLLKKDPETKNFIDPQNKRRIIRAMEVITATKKPFSEQRKKGEALFDILIMGLKRTPEKLKKIIMIRTKKMIQAGLIKEVAGLLKKRYSLKLPALSGIHYKEIIAYLKKKITLSEAIALINKNDEQLVRHQLTWFKKDQRIHWVENYTKASSLLKKFLQ